MSVSGASLGALRTKRQAALAPEPPSLPWFQLLLEKVAAVTPPSPLELLAGLACACRFARGSGPEASEVVKVFGVFTCPFVCSRRWRRTVMQNQRLPDWTTCLNSDQSLPLLLCFAIFMLEEAKTCNAVFSRRKTKDELSVKCMNIFYLNAWVMLGTNSTLIPGMGYLGRRSWQLPSLLWGMLQ